MEVHDLGEFANKDWPAPEKGFAKMIQNIDRDTGRIIDLLRELKIADNTLVIFTSDNGPHQEGGHKADYFDSNGPLRGMKQDLTEGGLRVPTIAWWPGTIKAGGADNAHWYFGDFMATFAALAGQNPRTSTATVSPARSWARPVPIVGNAARDVLGILRTRLRAGHASANGKPFANRCLPARLSCTTCPTTAAKKTYAERRPDLARHAANLMTKMHAPDPNWKVRGRR